MDETSYHTAANRTLARINDALESAYASGALDDLERADAVLTITTRDGRTYVISKHSPSRQLWLASPRLGGLHFSYQSEHDAWHLADGRGLLPLLAAELAHHGIAVAL